MSEVIYISDARLSFPSLVEPKVRTDATTNKTRSTYECDVILDQSNAGWGQFMQRFAELAAIAGKEHANALINMIMNDPKSRCFGDGNQKLNKKTFQPWEGYAGKMFIAMSSKTPYQLFGSDGKLVDALNTMAWQAAARKLYGGCRVNVAVKPWWQNANPQKGYGHGIRCDLVAIQFLRDDTPFGDSAPDASAMFGATPGAAVSPNGQFNQTTGSGGVPTNQLPGFPQQQGMPAAPFAGVPGGVSGLPPFMTR